MFGIDGLPDEFGGEGFGESHDVGALRKFVELFVDVFLEFDEFFNSLVLGGGAGGVGDSAEFG